MKKKIFEMVDVAGSDNIATSFYDFLMLFCIILSVIPLAFKSSNKLFEVIDFVTTGIFLIDYFLRLYTADLKLKKGVLSYFIYPITPMAIIDLLSILPSFLAVSAGFRLLRFLRIGRTFRVFRALKVVRYSHSLQIILRVIKNQKEPLLAVVVLAIGYVLISALVVFNVEPETFPTFFDAVYWATVSLTTIGYGDIYPVTLAGRIVTMLSSIIGIAVVAMPSGIITAGYLDVIRKIK